MNLEEIENRLKEIDEDILKLTSQFHTLQGHKAEANYWLNKIEPKEEDKNT